MVNHEETLYDNHTTLTPAAEKMSKTVSLETKNTLQIEHGSLGFIETLY